MSYILEALKKAQAERQLGSTPTIHALPIHATPSGPAGGSGKPLLLVAGACVVVGLGVAAVVWLQQPAAPVAEPVVAQVRVPVQAVQAPVQMPVPAPVPAAPPQAPLPAPVVAVRVPVPLPVPAPKPVRAPAPEAVAQAAPAPAPVPIPAPAPPVVEEAVMSQRELPEQIQRELPQLAFGGYIYSNNPADRLLLIDKVLRHEGEEVAPGVRLEKLLPRAAVLSYKGYRYKVAY